MIKLNIALLHYSCPPVVGGVEEVVRQQASLFHRHYHTVKIFTGRGGQFAHEYQVEINPLLGSRSPKILNFQKNTSEQPTKLAALSDEIFQYLSRAFVHFDILIAHNVLSMHYNLPLTYALHRLADSKQMKVISWNHDSPSFYENFPINLQGKPWNILRKYNPNIHYIVISESRRQQFLQLYGEGKKLEVVPNGVDPFRFFRLDISTVRIIQENDLFDADFILAQPCRLHPRKNIELSIQVTRALQDKGINARLLLTGAYDPHEEKTISYYRKLKKLAKQLKVEKNVLIMAEYLFESGEKLNVNRDTIRDLYLIADLLFMPSKQEGFGIPLLEAGMIKLPIVCSDIPPFREIGGVNVCYFSLQDTPEKIATKIVEFMKSLPPYQMHRKVMNKYVWDNIYHQTLAQLLERVMKN
ncbi:MAG: glycosyltransferase [Deltaproteobacteria bacterium]|nr:glycosyltransferase [Deltaproteobacteria bacterium]